MAGEYFQFENLDMDDILSGKRITWSPESIKLIRAFCAKHQISDRNRPTPSLLLDLLSELKVLDNIKSDRETLTIIA
ncbi:hypothetical protein AC579_8977 [Pseudocercospora musae]|uniref:Uncharacterized protein n=1 Tax=Pseudocercospora musae TaxID=113226 RepID=A0A139HNR0_9PEZI|nr:hypothetical protein AC579_8977 [Pseudocercospora musae]